MDHCRLKMEIPLPVKMKVRVGMGMVFLLQMATALVVMLLMEKAPGLVKPMELGDLMVWPHAQVMVKQMRTVMDLHPAEAPHLNEMMKVMVQSMMVVVQPTMVMKPYAQCALYHRTALTTNIS